MNLTLRYIALAFVSILSLHYLASYTSVSYQQRVDTLRSSWNYNASLHDAQQAAQTAGLGFESMPKANASFVVLCREGEINEILSSLQHLESTFNDRPHHRYPYVFLNDKPFSDNFKLRITRAVSSSVEFGQVPPEMWDIPPEIDMVRARKAWDRAASRGMPYGGSQSYRQMCRFQSGYFFRHPLVLKYKYYWRVEPNVKFFCDLTDFDPFRFMQQNNKKYGFVLSMHEIPGTVPSLWVRVREWYEKNAELLAPNNLFGFVTENNGRGYNKCHFWSNFEIADMDFFRSDAYLSFFKHLDQAGGFFYERWGDAPVHSIGAALLLDKSEFHYFDNVGYFHSPIMHCPKVAKESAISPYLGRSRCYCAHESSFTFDDNRQSCLYNYLEIMGKNSSAARDKFMKLDI
ncbi:glycosyltransferase family 15 protein [Moesziomyces antarcticus]|uniref:Probable KRE2 - alpha-1,2-mannosyltransferase n=1 Tax=Pseudozyma antarctica TaxID=84753 RepID=A0A5C3FKF0_PSEA2|nr:glycosyltransferase family 15 protein [Moesziomyces antarcticus]GAK63672.1 glycosyltransferase family 15 protein [Moesziomyces antarcticus]SPO44265.1 probable KRE2 - alpha-1,2-mannosyltransferase [Moesziomyces antarcticus]